MSADELVKPKGPYVLWKYHTYEGWNHEDYQTLKEAIEAEKHTSVWVITRGPIDYSVTEATP
jgi:hypothetical protein